MKLNTILTSGSWVEIADLLNDNFSKIAIAIDLGIDGDGGGGITIYDVEKYLEQYKYTTQDDVSAMLSPYVLKREVTPVITDLNTRVASIEMYFSTEEESDNTINKWNEIVAFLDGIKGDTLDNILVTKADKATTLAGYGITDAYTKAEADGKYLPLSGGTITNTGTILFINRTDGNPLIGFNNNGNRIGWLGFNTSYEPIAQLLENGASVVRKLLHSGNYSDYALPKDGTAVAATKVATARTIWGQSFDGTKDIDGNIITNGELFLNHTKAIRAKGSSGTNYNVLFTSGNDLNIGYDSPIIRFGVSKMFINSSGNVGIGTIEPTAKLHVDGDIKTTGHISAGSVNDYEERIAALEEKIKNL